MNTAKDLGGLAKENRERMMWVHDASESSERPGTIGRERIDVDLWSREGVDLKSEEAWRMEDWSGLVKLGTPPRFTRRETRTFSCSIRRVALNLIQLISRKGVYMCGGGLPTHRQLQHSQERIRPRDPHTRQAKQTRKRPVPFVINLNPNDQSLFNEGRSSGKQQGRIHNDNSSCCST